MPIVRTTILFLLLAASVFPQVKSNFTLVEEAVEASVSALLLTPGEMTVAVRQEGSFSVFEPVIVRKLSEKGIRTLEVTGEAPALTFSISEAGITYGEPFKDWFLGVYKIQRTATVKVGAVIKKDGSFDTVTDTVTLSDTVDFDSIRDIEDGVYPFTSGALPGKPEFGSIVEPILATVAAAAAIILFFTVRGK